MLLLTPYPPNTAPSQRFRFEQYQNHVQDFADANWYSFWNEQDMSILYQKGKYAVKLKNLIRAFGRRVQHIKAAKQHQIVFIHRELSPIGPPIFEWYLSKVLKKQIIYDFDDAIWLPNTSQTNKIAAKLKWHSKVKSICRWSTAISVGNHWLKEFAEHYNSNVHYIPTTLWANKTPSSPKNKNLIVWTGSHSTLHYLTMLEKPLNTLDAKGIPFAFRYIADKSIEEAGLSIQLPNIEFIRWSPEVEQSALSGALIGLMPLQHQEWEKGKCGFKLLQYMQQSIACIASDVGVNGHLLNSNNGILVKSPQEWEYAIELLLSHAEKAIEMGNLGRKRFEQEFTVEAQIPAYYNLINSVKALPDSEYNSIK